MTVHESALASGVWRDICFGLLCQSMNGFERVYVSRQYNCGM